MLNNHYLLNSLFYLGKQNWWRCLIRHGNNLTSKWSNLVIAAREFNHLNYSNVMLKYFKYDKNVITSLYNSIYFSCVFIKFVKKMTICLSLFYSLLTFHQYRNLLFAYLGQAFQRMASELHHKVFEKNELQEIHL